MNTDHKPLVAVFKKDIAILSHRLQQLLLCIHQYNVWIFYDPGPPTSYSWLAIQTIPQQNRDEEIPGKRLNINATETCMDIPECMTTEEIGHAALVDDHINVFSTFVMHGWLLARAEGITEIQPYWSFRGGVAVINGIMMKGKRIIIWMVLQRRALEQLHGNHMDIENTRLPVCRFIYRIGYKCWHRKCHYKLSCVSWFSANTSER